MKNAKILVGDFETTTGDITHTEVWSSAFAELNTENVVIFTNIEDGFYYLCSFYSNLIVYYHNLKFDGQFWLNYLMKDLEFEYTNEKILNNRQFSVLISHTGNWYSLKMKINNKIIELRDSYKLFPLKLADLGVAFNTKHRKLEMDYDRIKAKNTEINEKEKKYIKNDILVLKEVMEYAYNHGMDRLTIGSCCIHEFSSTFYKNQFKETFPDLTQINSPVESIDLDNYIRKSYKGGWCYLNDRFKEKIVYNGCTMDVNSLYPSVMLDENNLYPVGNPHYFFKDSIPKLEKNERFFIRIKCYFKLKKGFLPCIQIKNSIFYKATSWLESSDIVIHNKKISGFNGERYKPVLTLTQMDYEMFIKHYRVSELEILDGVVFGCVRGIFDEYLEKYRQIKENSTGALRTIAKLYSNNLYGQFGKSRNSSYKVPYIAENNTVKFSTIIEMNKKTLYVPIASFITSYSRCKTINTAQSNYKHFIYADTDSIHCDCSPDDLVDIDIDNKRYGAWKNESNWKRAFFVRQKTYIEESDELDIKCAGLTEYCKTLLEMSIRQDYDSSLYESLEPLEKDFVKEKRDIDDFKPGILIPSKLYSINTDGGIVLKKDYFNMR